MTKDGYRQRKRGAGAVTGHCAGWLATVLVIVLTINIQLIMAFTSAAEVEVARVKAVPVDRPELAVRGDRLKWMNRQGHDKTFGLEYVD